MRVYKDFELKPLCIAVTLETHVVPALDSPLVPFEQITDLAKALEWACRMRDSATRDAKSP